MTDSNRTADRGQDVRGEDDRSEGSATRTVPSPRPSDLADRELPPGSEVGPYRIESKLGQGGMGEVYLARRSDDSFEKRVAIKLIKQRRAVSSHQIDRFRRERQILAGLTHPSIAQLLDGGNTAGGNPYLVMEHVEGQPIDAYCRDRALSIDEILDLFQQICSAVQFAHQNLIVHRDLKPSNILVDAEGRVKLLDFGIAKILDAESFPMTVLETGPGSSPMTLAYASPEQVQADPITTATDVYSLGILLFELLTGQRPYAFDSRNLPAAVDAICRQEVSKPSDTIRRHGRSKETTHSAPWRRIQGDLDAIVLKALAKDPDRRYRSAEQMVEDIVRFRSSLPVLARKGNRVYRARKFLRRHGVVLSATATVFVILVSAVFLLLRQQEELTQERNRAEAVADWMVGLFEFSDPGQALGQEITVREVLDASSKTIRDDLADEPEVLHQMLVVLGKTYLSLGRSNEAQVLVEDALSLAREAGSAGQIADSILLSSQVTFRQGKPMEAYELATDALTRTRAVYPSTDPRTVQALLAKALPASDLDRFDEVKALYREAEELATAAGDRETLARILHLSAANLRGLDQHGKAERLLRRAVEIRRDILPANHPDLLWSELYLQSLNTRTPDQFPALLRSLEELKHLFARDSERLLAAVQRVATTAQRLELHDESLALYEKVLEISEASWGPKHIRRLTALTQLASIHSDQGDWAEAREKFEEVLPLARSVHGAKSRYVLVALNQWAILEIRAQRLDQAEEYLLEGLQIVEGTDSQYRYHTVILGNLGEVYLRRGDPEKAREYLLKSADVARKIEGDHERLGEVLYVLARVEKELDTSRAIKRFLEVWELLKEDTIYGPRAICRAARLEAQAGDLSVAEQYLAVCEEKAKRWPKDKFLRIYPPFARGLLLNERHDYEQAAETLAEVLQTMLDEKVTTSFVEDAREALNRAREGLKTTGGGASAT